MAKRFMAILFVGIGFYFLISVIMRVIYGKALVTRKNAVIAEESASASTEIHAELVNMRGCIRDVAELVGGGRQATPHTPIASNHPARLPVSAGETASAIP